MAVVNAEFLRNFSVTVDLSFKKGLLGTTTDHGSFTTMVGSTGRGNAYPTFDDIPGIREWKGARVVHDMSAGVYYVENRTFELTLGIKQEAIDDDNFGTFLVGIEDLGFQGANFPGELVFEALATGDQNKCSDGQYFFDHEHKALVKEGSLLVPKHVSNVQPGTGPTWYLLATRRPLKPMMYQTRRPFAIKHKTSPTDDNVFFEGKLVYGTDGRGAAVYGPWQFAYKSNAPLTAENYNKAVQMLASLCKENGKPIGVVYDKLLCGIALQDQARRLFKVDTLPGGESNYLKDVVEIQVSSWVQ